MSSNYKNTYCVCNGLRTAIYLGLQFCYCTCTDKVIKNVVVSVKGIEKNKNFYKLMNFLFPPREGFYSYGHSNCTIFYQYTHIHNYHDLDQSIVYKNSII